MTYLDSEASRHDGKPIELFKFEGTYANYYYTSAPKLITFDGHDYTPQSIKRSDVNAGTQEDDGLDLTLEIPASIDLAQTYGFSQTPPRLYLTIYRYHRGAPGDWVRFWAGPINQIQTNDGRSTLRSPSALATALQAQVPSVYYQGPCNNTLFDDRCRILEDDWTVSTTVSSVAGRVVNVASVGALDGKMIGGELKLASGEARMIVAQTGTAVTVNFPFFALVPTTAITMTAGCDGAYTGDCKVKFANQRRFTGMPFIPNENIFVEGALPPIICPDGTCLPHLWDGWDYEISVYTTWNSHDSGLTMYIWPPPGGTGGNAIGGAIGSDFTTLFGSPPPNASWDARRINMGDPSQPVGALNMDGVGNWNVYLDVGIVNVFGEVPQNHIDINVFMRHWTEDFPGPLVYQNLGYIDNSPFHNLNPVVNETIDWRSFR